MIKIVTTLILLSLIAIYPSPTLALDSAWKPECFEIRDGDNIPTLQGIQCLVINVIQVAIRLIGIVAFVMIIFGGIKLLISGGDAKATEAAKSTVTLAIAGIFLAVFSWFILVLVEQFTGVNVTVFDFPLINPVPTP